MKCPRRREKPNISLNTNYKSTQQAHEEGISIIIILIIIIIIIIL